jgi:hypothetical protein
VSEARVLCGLLLLALVMLSCTGRFGGEVTAIAPAGCTFSESRSRCNVAFGGLSFSVPESVRSVLCVGDSVWGRYDLECVVLSVSEIKHTGLR